MFHLTPRLGLLLVLAVPALAGAVPGTLDLTFGVDGVVEVRERRPIREIHMLPDDRFLLVGFDERDFIALRYLADGTPDRSYGDDGTASRFVSGRHSVLTAVVTPDGGVVIGGTYLEDSVGGLVLVRFDADGNPDTSFGDAGLVRVPIIADELPVISSLLLAADGTITLTAIDAFLGDEARVVVARFLADGSLDPAYGTNGIVHDDLGAVSGALLPDGRLMLAAGGVGHVRLVRLDPSGDLDATFGGGGHTQIPIAGHPNQATVGKLLRRSDGRFIVPGKSEWPMSGFWTLQFDETGALDPSYGNGGLGESWVGPTDLAALEGDGDLVLSHSLTLVRVLAGSGTLDPGFFLEVEDYLPGFHGFALDSAGRVVVYGRVTGGSPSAPHGQLGLVFRRFSGDCGDGVQQPNEQCDDGNTADGDCCSSTCRLDAAGAVCDADGDLCSSDTCDGTGACVAGSATPRSDCARPALPGGAKLTYAAGGNVSFTWSRGDVLSASALGHPTSSTSWALCVYDEIGGVPALALGADLPAAGTCKGKPCWKRKGATVGKRGWVYKDAERTPEGVASADASEGLVPGKAKGKVKTTGAPAAAPPLAHDTRVVVEVRTSVGACFGASFSSALKNDATKFMAVSD